MPTQDLTVNLHVQPFMHGEALTADRLNELVRGINQVREPLPSLTASVLCLVGAATQSPRRMSRRALLGLSR